MFKALASLGAALAVVLAAVGAAWAGADTVTLWHSYRGAEERALLQVVAEFNRRHGGDIHIEVIAQPNDSYASKLTTAIPRDNGPDVFIFGNDRIGDWAESGIIAALDLDDTDRARFLAETLPPASYRGRLYGLPLAFKSTVLFYNRALIAAPPRTTDELVAMGERLSRDDRVGLAYLYDDFYYHAAWFFGFGAELWTKDGTLDLASAPSIAALEFVRDLEARDIVPSEPSGALILQLFNSGRAAMVINGPWFVAEIDPALDYGIAPLPVVSATGTPARPFLTTEVAMVSARARDPESARVVARFLAGADSALIRATVGRQAVAHRSPWTKPELEADAQLQVFLAQLPHTRSLDNDPRSRLVWEPAQVMLRKLTRGGAEPEIAATAGVRRFSAISRTSPPPTSPLPYVVLVCLAVVAALFKLGRDLIRLYRGGQLPAARRGWAWIGPAITATVILLFIPFVVGLALSLFDHHQGEWSFVGLANFRDILGAGTFAPTEPLSFYFALVVTVLWTVTNLALHVGIGLFLAILLARPALRLRPVYRVLLIVPWAVPNYITALIWKSMFSTQQGVINSFLVALGLDRVEWFSSFPTAFFANLCTNAWLGFPFMMIVCLGALQAIPKDLYEAADVDGASGWQKFRHITVPLLRPALLPAILIGTVWTFNQFNIVYLVSGGEPDSSTDILISEAYRWAFTRQDQYGYAAAYAALIFVILLGWSVFAARMGRRIEANA